MSEGTVVIRVSTEPSSEDRAELLNRLDRLERSVEASHKLEMVLLRRIARHLEPQPAPTPGPRVVGSIVVHTFGPFPE